MSLSSPSGRLRSSRALRRALVAVTLCAGGLVAGSASAGTVDTGSQHTCAVSVDARVFCWGDNTNGQLGDGTTTDSTRPVAVTGLTGAAEVAVTHQSSCAVQASGTVRCWGKDGGGALGDDAGVDSPTPVQVTGLTDAVAIERVASGFCALRDGGRVSCWGVGLGEAGAAEGPYELTGVTGALDITGGTTELCIVWAEVTRCRASLVRNQWGGGVAPEGVVELPGSTNIQKIDAQLWASFDGCAVLSSGQVSCWGTNSQGQLGNGVTSDRPLARGQSLALGITDARSVFTAFGVACALHETGAVSCWGSSSSLSPGGEATTAPVTTPVVRSDLRQIRAISGAEYHACATTDSGALQCWGYNGDGQLGDGTQVTRPTAVTVPGLQVAASSRDSLTPIRRNEADVTVPDPVPGTTPGTTPGATTPGATTPTGTTPHPTTPTGTTPGGGGIDPGGYPPLAVPTVLFQDGVLVLADFRVAPLRSGRCPRRALVNIRSGRVTMARTLAVQTTIDGRCTVTGWIRLGRRLAKARALTITVGAPGTLRSAQRVTFTR